MQDSRASITFYLPGAPITLEGDVHAVHALAEFLWHLPGSMSAFTSGTAAQFLQDPLVIIGCGTQILSFPAKTPILVEVPEKVLTSSAITNDAFDAYKKSFSEEIMGFHIELDKDLFPVTHE
ncbi:hypothetical protein [Rothia nasimurium]|uniref:hypothetical protein n=1 Tax=Rothia nasimurium TaxID=85336 RepID=UPI001F279890|nr:hypothetical protein [Rothia nasimurium]